MTRPPLRRIWHVVLLAVALAPPVAGVGYVLYSELIAREASQQLAMPYDGFYWDGAQLEIAYGRLTDQVLLYRTGISSDFDEVRLRYDIVESKLAVAAASTSLLTERSGLRSRSCCGP